MTEVQFLYNIFKRLRSINYIVASCTLLSYMKKKIHICNKIKKDNEMTEGLNRNKGRNVRG